MLFDLEDTMTVARDNHESLRQYLRMRKLHGAQFSPYSRIRLFQLLENRRLYRSNESIEVWVIERGYEGNLILKNEEEFKDYLSEWDSHTDEPIQWHKETMTGRQFGNLMLLDE